ncbi:MAG: lipase family protein [Ferruginibacter sp.]|nr:lipase family protein [Cytophagales bacterium]
MIRNAIQLAGILLLMGPIHPGHCQALQPGFDKLEYVELLKAYSRWGDSAFYRGIPESKKYRPAYRSPVTGLENRWELYTTDDQVAVISIRGTTADPVSWLGNFYAAMVPAKGTLRLSDQATFEYQLAENPKAAVHTGWLVALASMSADIRNKMDSCYRAGVRDYLVFGHSQGGGIAYLLTSHLRHLKAIGQLPGDIRLKTYCSAGPKPGNLYYAYEYEKGTEGGWAFNVVNPVDWVPEVPVSIQTEKDFNPINPFVNARQAISQQKFPTRIALKHLYNQLTKHTNRAQRRYEKYLGRMTSQYVKKQLPDFRAPDYYPSNHYVRTGNFIILAPDSAYYQVYPNDEKRIFIHHMLQPYFYLAQQLK